MAIALTMTARTETTITLGVSGQASGGLFDLQFATRPDFQFCIATLVGPLTGSTIGVGALNRRQTYYWRARDVVGGVRQGWGATVALATLPGVDTPAPAGVQVQPAILVVPQPVNALAGSSPVPGYPIQNLLSPSPVPAWRASSSGDCTIQIELSGEAFDTIALLETNLPETATIAVYGGDTRAAADGNNSPFAYGPIAFRASPNLPGRRGYHGLIRLPGLISYRFIRLQIVGAGAGGVVHATHLVVGRGRAVKNFAEMTEQSFDLGTLERTRDGAADAVRGFRGRRVDFEIAAMTEQQYEQQFSDIAALVGNTDPVFIIPNSRTGPYLHDRLLYGNLTGGRMSYSNARITRGFSIDSVIN